MKNRYFIQLVALFTIVLLDKTVWGQQYPSSSSNQTLCFGTSQPYCVDCLENGGTGTAGSTYTWSIINGPGVPTFSGQGTNRINIDWSTVGAGSYTLQVLETTTSPASCNGVLSSMSIVINPLLQATVAPVTPICSGSDAVFNFTGPANGTITYTLNSGANTTVTLNGSGAYTLTIPAVSADQTIDLVSVTDGICTNPVTGTATVVINNLLAATISPVTPICSGAAAVFNVNGPANGTVVIDILGTNYNINLDGAGVGSYSVANATVAVTASLVSVSNGTCSNPVTGNATVDISPLLTASVSATSPICYDGTATFNFTGTPGATVTFTVNGSTQTVALNGSGIGTYSVSNATIDQAVVLVSATNGICTNPVSGGSNIVVSPLLQASVSSVSPICYNGNAVFTFTGAPNTTVTYTLNVSTLTVALDASGNGSNTVSNATSTQTVALVSITDGTCTNTISGGSSVVVNPLLQATVTPVTPICSGSDAVFNFTGPANGTITYTLNSGANTTVTLNGSGAYTLTIPAVSADQTIDLVSVTDGVCTNPVTGTATVVINNLLAATISPVTPICSGAAAVFNVSGPANGTVVIAISGTNYTINLDGAGVGSYSVANATAAVTASLVSVSNGTCSNPVTGNATVDISPLLTASVSATSPICYDGTATFNFTGTPGATVTFTANGSSQTLALNGSGIGTYSVNNATIDQAVVLVSATNGTCTNPVSGSSNIVVSPLLPASVSSASPICYNGNAVFTFTGAPNTTVTYTLNGSTLTVALDASGNGINTVSNATSTQTVALLSITDGTCTNTISGGSSVVVNPLLQATVTPVTPICSGSDAVFNFTGPANGTITYTLNSGANTTVTLNGSGAYTLTIPAVSADQTIDLVSVSDGICTNPVTGTATVVINSLLTATVSSVSPICYQDAAVFTFTGPANGTISFLINGGTNQTVALDASGAGTFTVNSAIVDQSVSLVSVSNGTCTNPLTGISSVTVNPQINTTSIFHN